MTALCFATKVLNTCLRTMLEPTEGIKLNSNAATALGVHVFCSSPTQWAHSRRGQIIIDTLNKTMRHPEDLRISQLSRPSSQLWGIVFAALSHQPTGASDQGRCRTEWNAVRFAPAPCRRRTAVPNKHKSQLVHSRAQARECAGTKTLASPIRTSSDTSSARSSRINTNNLSLIISEWHVQSAKHAGIVQTTSWSSCPRRRRAHSASRLRRATNNQRTSLKHAFSKATNFVFSFLDMFEIIDKYHHHLQHH